MTLGFRVLVALVVIGTMADVVTYMVFGRSETMSHQMWAYGERGPLVIALWFVFAALLALHFWGWRRLARFFSGGRFPWKNT